MADNSTGDREPAGVQRVRVDISWRSVFRVLAGVLIAYAAILLWPLFAVLILASVVATALYPIITAARKRGWPRWVGLMLATTALLVIVVGCFAIIGPLVFQEMSLLGENLPRIRDQILAQLPPSGLLRHAFQNALGTGTVDDSRILLERLMAVAQTTLGGLAHFVMVIVLAIYLMSDGPRALRWIIVFFPSRDRERIVETLRQVSSLISSYVAGQFLVSAFAAVYLFLVLEFLGVPMALLLGIIAGICDILPIVGFVIAVFLAMAIGFTVSPGTSLLVFAFYGVYHVFENFFIIPRVYGRRLRLSLVAVPLAIAAGGLLAGVVGAIAILPIVAAYPVVERLWLAPRLAPDTLKAHQESDFQSD